jgi:hypothetical protein
LEESDILFHLSMSIQDILRYTIFEKEVKPQLPFSNLSIENFSSKKVKPFKSNNAKEYNSQEIWNFFRNKGFAHKKSIAYIYIINRMAEQFNRTLVNMARVILLESKLLKRLWAEVMNYSVYRKNQLPHCDRI